MRDDYLWDGSGEADPDIRRLEEALAPLRHRRRPAPALPRPHPFRRVPRRARTLLLAAAVFALVAAAVWRIGRRPLEGLEVAVLEGAPRIGRSEVRDTGRLKVGEILETDASSRARIAIGMLGEVQIDPRTRVGLVGVSEREHRLALERGTLHARIWAPPGLFVVDIPSATAIDLGCAYTLEVDETGDGLLRVTSGWVAFEWMGRESFVPEGALCVTRRGRGPGTPYRSGASGSFEAALAVLDFGGADAPGRAAALEAVLAASRREDALTLWHLLAGGDRGEREQVFDRLASLVPPPGGVTRPGILGGDRAMRDLWWDHLGLRSAAWWRLWKGPPPRT